MSHSDRQPCAKDGFIDSAYNRLVSGSHLSASTIDSSFYVDPGLFDLEVERIFRPSWHMVCREEDLPNIGDYVCDVFLGEHLFVVRNEHGKIKAFSNVCRHRWSTLLEGCGNIGGDLKRIVCPYHRWTYDLSGNLLGAPNCNAVEGFCKADYHLHEMQVHAWRGFVFVNLNKDAEPFEQWIGEYDSLVAPYMNNLTCVRKTNYEVAANWKCYIEVDMETYHTPSVHPTAIGHQHVEVVSNLANVIGVFHECDQSVALPPGQRHEGFPFVPGLSGKARAGTHFCVILPSFFIVHAQDSMWWIHKVPVSVDKTEVRCGFAFPQETIDRPDFEAVSKKYFARWDTVIEEDNWIVQKQYQGLQSNGAGTKGRYAEPEEVVFDFNLWVLEKLSRTASK